MNMKELLEQMKLVFDLMGSEEFTDSAANFAWKMFEKLKAKGFTEDQAMKLVVGMSKTK